MPKLAGRLPRRPTKYLPGTKGKARIQERRANRGESIHHPKDAAMDSADVVRIPKMVSFGREPRSGDNVHILDWLIADEKEYYRTHERPSCPLW